MSAVPSWLPIAAQLSVSVALACTVVVVVHIWRRPQRMWIMNLVWPLTTLWAGPVGLWAYVRLGQRGRRDTPRRGAPFWQQVALGTSHCGAGCTLGDLVAETLTVAVPVVLFGHRVFGTWAADLVLAFVFGIGFQFFTIAPMRGLSVGPGLVAAIKADAASLLAWQVGMYGFMALALFRWFSPAMLPKTGAVFWFMMQLAMFAGFATSAPVNVWLIRSGLKERM